MTDYHKATAVTSSKVIFHEEASYILVGGLGGIGREIASWMVEHGAKYLVLVNRSGLATDAAQSTIRLLREHGAEVVVRGCDISDEQSFSEMYMEISQTMPPVKGVIQGAMILKVSYSLAKSFSNMFVHINRTFILKKWQRKTITQSCVLNMLGPGTCTNTCLPI